MGLKKLFFGKKKENNDGQDEFFKDDFEPVFYPSPKKKNEPKSAKPAQKEERASVEKTTEAKKPAAKTTSKVAVKTETKSTAKSEAKKSTTAAKTPSVAKSQAVSKTTSVKKAEAKPATAKSSKSAEKAVTKSTSGTAKKATAVSAKPAAKAAPKASTKSKKAVIEAELADDSPIVKGAVAVSESNETANGKWEIRRAKDGRYFFALYASNHTVIAYSQIYSSTTAVNTGINSVIVNAQKCETEDTTLKKTVSIPCPKWEIYLDKADQYRFRLYAPNGLCICHSSHGYSTKSGCKGGIESIKRFSTEAKVSKSYKK